MKFGVNSVLFGGYDMETAFRCVAMAGYDGIEISAIEGMSEHLVLDRWQKVAPEVKRLFERVRLGTPCNGAALPRSASYGSRFPSCG